MKFKSLSCIALSAVIFFSCQTGSAAALHSVLPQNPFAVSDKERETMLTAAAGKYERGKTAKAFDNKTENSVSGGGLIIKFKGDVPFSEIHSLLAPYTYDIIGGSKNRLFALKDGSPDKIKKDFAGKYVYAEQDETVKLQTTANDPKLPEQWAIDKTNITRAWDISKGSQDVVVAMIDTGIYRDHEDLASANIAAGWDFISKKPVDCDVYGHGTMTTGVIAAGVNNGLGIAGVCWNVKIIPYQVFGEYGGAEFSDICDALYAAVDDGADIINMSLGGYYKSSAMGEAVANAVSHGCIVVAAAGNEYGPDYMYPASYDGVISCSSIDKNLEPSYFTSYNDKVDVASPGEDVLCVSAEGTDEYESVDGTSFSSPYVAGIAALAKAYDDSINAADFQRILKATSTDLGDKGFDDYYGYGVVNAEKVLTYLQAKKTSDFIVQDGVLVDYRGSGSSAVIPTGVTSIRSEAFSNCASLESVVIPGSVTGIGSKAFYHCTNLKNVTIPGSVAMIGTDAFGGTPWLADYPGDFVVAGDGILIKYKGSAANITIPGNVKSIGEYAFAGNKTLTGAVIPGSVTSIADYAFYGFDKSGNMNSLASVTVPATVKTIGYNAFAGTPWLESCPGDFLIAGDGILLNYNGVGGFVTVPKEVKDIGQGAFEDCTGLYSIDMHRGVTRIGDYAFRGCSDLAIVTVSGSVTTIGEEAFAYCRRLESIIIPKNVTHIENSAFKNCGRIKFTCAPGSAAADFANGNRFPVIDIVPVDGLALNTESLTWFPGQSGKLTVSIEPGYATDIAVGWVSSNPLVAAVDNTGKVTAVGFGSAVLTCTAEDGNGAKAVCSIRVIPATPESLSARSVSYNSIMLTWNSVKGVDGYDIYRYSPISENYDLIKSTSGTSYTNTGLTTEKNYYFKVRAYKKSATGKIYSGYSKAVVCKPVLGAPASFKVIKAGSTALKLAWSPVAGADGYEIWRYSDFWDKYFTLATVNAAGYTNIPRKADGTYYYKVRAYRVVGGKKLFGSFSEIKYTSM